MDFKLKIFKTVSLVKSFSKAAKILHLSQPAVSKAIKSLEQQYSRAFFERGASSIELTADGMIFLEYCEKINHLYEQLEDEFLDNNLLPNHIKLGASTTIANYILPGLIAKIQKKYPQLEVSLMIGNTLDIQQAILKKEINLGIVEGDNHHTLLTYKKFIEDELVLVSKYGLKNIKNITKDNLSQIPIIGRELGSGTREVIENCLHKNNLEILEYHSIFGSTESVKSYLLDSNAYSFLSVHSIARELEEKRLVIIDVKGLAMSRWFYFITRQGFQSKTNDKFQNLLIKTYNQR